MLHGLVINWSGICGMLHGLVINWSSSAIETSRNRVNVFSVIMVSIVMIRRKLGRVARETLGIACGVTPLCCDDIYDVTPRVSALAGCYRLVSEPLVIEKVEERLTIKLVKGEGVLNIETIVTTKDGTITKFFGKFPEYKPTKEEEENFKLKAICENVIYDISDSDSDLESTARSGSRDSEMEVTGGSGIRINA
ncbi:hypothetical protein Tco_1477415 [Tanacetum coccineum]